MPEAAPPAEAAAESLTDDEIMGRARNLGMVLVRDLPDTAPEPEAVSDDEIIRRAKALGYVHKDDIDTPTLQTQTDITEAIDSADDRAENTGVNDLADDEHTDSALNTANSAGPEGLSATGSLRVNGSSGGEVSEDGDSSGIVTVTIPPGGNSESIAQVLFEYGVVDDAAAFNRYIVEQSRQTKLIANVYQIRKGLTYEELLYIITH
jgi:hypothetical protein